MFITRVFWKESSATNIYFSPVRLTLNSDLRNYKVTSWCCYIKRLISGNLLLRNRKLTASPVGKNLPAVQEMRVRSLGWENPCRRKLQCPPIILPGESHGRRSLVGYRLYGHKRVGQDSATKQQLQSQRIPNPLIER